MMMRLFFGVLVLSAFVVCGFAEQAAAMTPPTREELAQGKVKPPGPVNPPGHSGDRNPVKPEQEEQLKKIQAERDAQRAAARKKMHEEGEKERQEHRREFKEKMEKMRQQKELEFRKNRPEKVVR